MSKKLVDTIDTFGRAEQNLMLSPEFEKWARKQYNLTEIKAIDPVKVAKTFNLKGIVFGNYVTQEERHFYLYKIEKQMQALAKMHGNNNLGKGKLVLSIGAQGVGGGSNAHYSPANETINLARGRKGDYRTFLKGESSFVHEYGHFLDFQQGRFKDKRLNKNFASENTNPNAPAHTLLFSKPVDLVIKDQAYMENLTTRYLESRIEIFARLFEAAINVYVHKHLKQFAPFFERTYSQAIYYPKNKIIDLKIDKDMYKIMRLQ